jgi:hypothetical protein
MRATPMCPNRRHDFIYGDADQPDRAALNARHPPYMHGEAIGIAKSPAVALSYLGIAGILLACAKYAVIAPAQATIDHAHAVEPAE